MTHPPLTVRPVRASDRAAWQPLWDGYNAFYGRHGDTALPANITDTTWARFLDPAQPLHALVAERSGHIVGLSHHLFHASTTRLAGSCYLSDLFTVPQQRGSGVGRALIEAVYAAAQSAGVERVYWLTHETNTAGRALYDRIGKHAGFIVYGNT
jgi:GNAT superfamily N-acetyltransferase